MKEVLQPQDDFAWGLLNLKPRSISGCSSSRSGKFYKTNYTVGTGIPILEVGNAHDDKLTFQLAGYLV